MKDEDSENPFGFLKNGSKQGGLIRSEGLEDRSHSNSQPKNGIDFVQKDKDSQEKDQWDPIYSAKKSTNVDSNLRNEQVLEAQEIIPENHEILHEEHDMEHVDHDMEPADHDMIPEEQESIPKDQEMVPEEELNPEKQDVASVDHKMSEENKEVISEKGSQEHEIASFGGQETPQDSRIIKDN